MTGLIEALFKALETGLRIWEHKEKSKYIDKISYLKKRISDESAKTLETRDQNIIDHCHRDLLLITQQWCIEVTRPDIINKS